MSLELVFPLDIDPEAVKDLLLNTYHENETILEKPASFVRKFQQVAERCDLLILSCKTPSKIAASFHSISSYRLSDRSLRSDPRVIPEAPISLLFRSLLVVKTATLYSPGSPNHQ